MSMKKSAMRHLLIFQHCVQIFAWNFRQLLNEKICWTRQYTAWSKKARPAHSFCFYFWNTLTKSDNSWHTSAAVYSKYSAASFTRLKCTTIGSSSAPHRTETFVGVRCIVLTADQVVHWWTWDDHCHDAYQLYRDHQFLDELVRDGVGLPLLF